MVNEKVISDKKMVEHIKAIIVRYYEDAFLKNASVDEELPSLIKNLKSFIEQSSKSRSKFIL